MLYTATILLGSLGLGGAPLNAYDFTNPLANDDTTGRNSKPTTSEPAPQTDPAVQPRQPGEPPLAPMDGVSQYGFGNQPPSSRSNSDASGWQQTQPTATGPGRSDPATQPATTPAPYTTTTTGTGTRAVQQSDLSPVMTADGSGMPMGLWKGLTVPEIEQLFSSLTIPPRSPALHALWQRLITSEASAPSTGNRTNHFEALRLEALYRSGLLDQAAAVLDKKPQLADDALLSLLGARADIALNRQERGCQKARRLVDQRNKLPERFAAEAILLTGYCAAADGNPAAAGLAADLARESGQSTIPGLSALDAIAAGEAPHLTGRRPISVFEYHLLKIGRGKPPENLIPRATPALLVAIAKDPQPQSSLQIAAGEEATRLNALATQDLAAVYERHASQSQPGTPNSTVTSPNSQTSKFQQRAQLFLSAILEQTPNRKARLIRSFLDNARRAALYLQALKLMAPAAASLRPAAEIAWFTETAIEIALAAGDIELARRWWALARNLDPRATGKLEHWQALIDIADPQPATNPHQRGQSLASVEQMALQGQFGSEQLHRLATVLDALQYNVPIPLWEAASRTPQPSGGHLPETGVLSKLQEAARQKQFGRTILLAMKALGPNGAEGAHMIALGDAIRALKSAGLEADARRLGFEALFASWPRTTGS